MILVLKVIKYLSNNVHADYDDGTFESFDTTQVRVVEPVEAAGRSVRIDHNSPPPAESPWRKIGARLRLDADDDILEEKRGHSREIFSSGIQILAVE